MSAILDAPSLVHVGYCVDELVRECYGRAVAAGWYTNPATGEPIRHEPGTRIALMHSELSEMLEAVRKDIRQSEHLPEFTGEEEEAADLVIRLCDYSGARGLRLGEAIIAKLAYNATREDHKLENRAKEGGKSF